MGKKFFVSLAAVAALATSAMAYNVSELSNMMFSPNNPNITKTPDIELSYFDPING